MTMLNYSPMSPPSLHAIYLSIYIPNGDNLDLRCSRSTMAVQIVMKAISVLGPEKTMDI